MSGAEWTSAAGATGVLKCLGRLPKACQYRIDVALQGEVALSDRGLQLLEAPAGAQCLELAVKVEDERGSRGSPRQP